MDWRNPNVHLSRDLLLGLAAGFSLAATSASLAAYVSARQRRKNEEEEREKEREEEGEFPFRPIELRSDEIAKGVCGAIGKFSLSVRDFFFFFRFSS